MQINEILVFPIPLQVIWIPRMATPKVQPGFLQGSGKATGAAAMHAQNADNAHRQARWLYCWCGDPQVETIDLAYFA